MYIRYIDYRSMFCSNSTILGQNHGSKIHFWKFRTIDMHIAYRYNDTLRNQSFTSLMAERHKKGILDADLLYNAVNDWVLKFKFGCGVACYLFEHSLKNF